MKVFKKFLVPTIASVILFFLLFALRFNQDHYVADSFSVTGLVLILFCGLIFVADQGVFDIVVFGTKKFIDLFRKNKQTTITYQEYVLAKKSKEKITLWPLLVVGGIYFVIGLIMSIVVM